MKIGLTNGCMDLFHDGHHHYLARCKQQCDYLIIALNSDASVQRLKGPTRPRQDWMTRMEAVMDTGLVDALIPFEGRWDVLAEQLRPAVIFQSEEYSTLGDYLQVWSPRVPELIPIIYIERLPGYSTSLQIESLAAKTNA